MFNGGKVFEVKGTAAKQPVPMRSTSLNCFVEGSIAAGGGGDGGLGARNGLTLQHLYL